MERALVYCIFIYLIIEGALRKWVFPSFGTQLFLVKDLLLLILVVVHVGKKAMRRAVPAPGTFLTREILFLGGWVFLTCGSLLVTGFSLNAFIGLSYYLAMIPLVIIIPRILDDVHDLEGLMLKYVWIAVPILLLGIAQFNSSPDAFINRYAWSTSSSLDIAQFGENKARITGTFSYISPYAAYLQFMFLVAFALLILSESDYARLIMSMIVSLVLINIAMTGSRAPLLITLLVAIPFINRYRQILKRNLGGWSFVQTIVLISSLIFLSGNVFKLVSERDAASGDTDQRIWGAFYTPQFTFNSISLVGSGIGSTFLGVREMGDKEQAEFDEVNSDRLGVELGTFGYIFILCFKFLFLLDNWNLYRSATDSRIRIWSLVTLCNQVSYLWSIPVYNMVAAAFYFGSIGLYIYLRNEQARIIGNARQALVPVCME